jgi:hypothetical protein
MMQLNERTRARWGSNQWTRVRLDCVETEESVSHAQSFICNFYFDGVYKGCGVEATTKAAAKESCAEFVINWLNENDL